MVGGGGVEVCGEEGEVKRVISMRAGRGVRVGGAWRTSSPGRPVLGRGVPSTPLGAVVRERRQTGRAVS